MRLGNMIILLVLPVILFGADRVVLLEDFTNYQCGPCWSFEPTLNNFVNSHPDDLAVIRPHVWWPGGSDPIYNQNNYEQWHRVQLYGVNSVPWIKFDGVIKASTSGSGLTNAFNKRIAVPCFLEIQVANSTSDGAGSIIIMLIAEQDPGGNDIFCNAVLIESNIPESGGELSIYDTSGRCVATGTIEEGISTDFNLNTSGVYFAEVVCGKTVTIDRIVVLR